MKCVTGKLEFNKKRINLKLICWLNIPQEWASLIHKYYSDYINAIYLQIYIYKLWNGEKHVIVNKISYIIQSYKMWFLGITCSFVNSNGLVLYLWLTYLFISKSHIVLPKLASYSLDQQ
jgi:hypothetical protein